MTASATTADADADDAIPSVRQEAFCAVNVPEIFESVVHAPQIWNPSPFDVESIHADARAMFGSLLRRASALPAPSSGRALLLLGEAGSGKTHLLQAFRHTAHSAGLGYFGYLQMTTETANYARYILRNLITSLDEPYSPPIVTTSGIARLSTALFDAIPRLTPAERELFQSSARESVPALVNLWADRVVEDPRFADCDQDLIRTLIYLQRDDPRIKSRVLKWLRCEDLSAADRAALGDLVPRNQDEDAIVMIGQLGRLMHTLQGAALVLCVDQLEDVFSQDMPHERFRRAIDALVALAEQVPTAIVVIACLEDYFTANKQHLTRSKLDRLEVDPEPIRLTTSRTLDEIETLLARRLEFLYEEVGLTPIDPPSAYPYSRQHLTNLAGNSARKVLSACGQHHQRCVIAGKWIEPAFGSAEADAGARPDVIHQAAKDAQTPIPPADLDLPWNDFKDSPIPVPDSENELAELLAWGIERCNQELHDGHQFIPDVKGRYIALEMRRETNGSVAHLVAICNAGAQGGWLGKQVTEMAGVLNGRIAVLVRSTPFPKDPRVATARQIGRMIGETGRRVEVENSDWRTLALFRAFSRQHGERPGFAAWQQNSRPLSQLAAMRQVLALDKLPSPRVVAQGSSRSVGASAPGSQAPTSSPIGTSVNAASLSTDTESDPPARSEPILTSSSAAEPIGAPVTSISAVAAKTSRQHSDPQSNRDGRAPESDPSGAVASGTASPTVTSSNVLQIAGADPILLGHSIGVRSAPIEITPDELRQHMAFLGGSGSGKTTSALVLIESLLQRGIPAILIDRKGDMARYADPDAWTAPDDATAASLQRLRSRVDVVLYTPGATTGRPLAIPLVPDGIRQLPSADREQMAHFAAESIAAMAGYKSKPTRVEGILKLILKKAIEVLAEVSDQPITLDGLRELIANQDDALVNALGNGYNAKEYTRLAEDLQTLALQHKRLLSDEAEPLKIDALLGRGSSAVPGKTRLSIIHTGALGSPATVEFWMAQFFLALDRWRSQSPSDTLQAVVFLDEADQYLPAVRVPTTKAPLESLLRRARSAGLGLMLATQSPGDFDYKCKENIRAWLVGRVKEPVALNKLKPMFSESKLDVAAKLPAQKTGEFFLLREGQVIALKSLRSLIETRQLSEERILELAGVRGGMRS